MVPVLNLLENSNDSKLLTCIKTVTMKCCRGVKNCDKSKNECDLWMVRVTVNQYLMRMKSRNRSMISLVRTLEAISKRVIVTLKSPSKVILIRSKRRSKKQSKESWE